MAGVKDNSPGLETVRSGLKLTADSGRKGHLRNEDGIHQVTRGMTGNMKLYVLMGSRGGDRDRDRDRD